MNITTHTIEANGFRFAVDEAGEGDHLALCLHGFPESRFSWRFQLPLLAELGYRAWAPDLRGYGETEPKPQDVASYRVERLMEDVASLIDASGAKTVTLLAHDWGAGVGWTFAINRIRPLDRLVIMNLPHPAVMQANLRRNWAQLKRSWYMFFFQLPAIPERALTRNDAQGIRRAFFDMAVDKSNFGPEVLDRYARDAQRPGAMRAMINWYRAAFRTPGKLAGPFPVLETPTLVIWGEQDSALGVELLDGTDAYVRNLTIERLPGVSHWVQQEAPEKVNAILKSWLPRAG
ncbi:alpha/beta fold hydrolase [Phenylobacterium kunshanense]|uniref:Alpha/beta hydrolase n=1 Tax=Phenylobacterium kunshanense TaxID=1445034 RepID=A0A328BS41_9CAUL|nr:alpha/beta hydrolase [Phenylobacterium kunshanense]RAK68674.1 alpha/beta hydrolase [Phenylobacterium kunshanense]